MTDNSKILIVDDDSIATDTLRNLLTLEGFDNAVYFNNPEEALSFLKDNSVAVIISDFLMPQMNGIEFLTKAKQYAPNSSTILFTGYADKENAIKAINEVGIYKYIEKPWDNDLLVLSIKNGIERSQLVTNLQTKVAELEKANAQIEKYSHSLEELVAEKTFNLIESNKKLSAVINYCADSILTINSDGKITQVNQAFETLTGLGSNLLNGKLLTDILNFKNYADIQQKLTQLKEFFVRDAFVKNNLNNREIPLEISFAPIINNNTNNTSYVCVLRNVQLQKELDRLRDDFIATLTHDLRTPLLATIQALEFFLDGTLGNLTDRQFKILETMKRSNEDILGLVNALLEVYKYESGRIMLYKDNFKINELVEFVVQELAPLAGKKKIEFELNVSETENAEILADKNELRRVLVNLCGNAINHNNEGKKVIIKTAVEKQDLILSVKDDGEGIEKKDIPKMFKRFSQIADRRATVSTGLGLYLSRQIVEAHGGKIWVESDKHKGSEFFFLLPDCLSQKILTKNG